MKEDIKAAEPQISGIVSQAVEEVFNTMFRESVLAGRHSPPPDLNNVVVACVKLNHGTTEIDFCFNFDMQLLLQAAAIVFSQEYIKGNPVHEDLACEIANIVCHKVKAYLNEEGYHTDMGFPFIPESDQDAPLKQEELVRMHFFYRDQDAQRRVGVAVNFFVAL
jgi:CheY-specific phosphatase CheX